MSLLLTRWLGSACLVLAIASAGAACGDDDPGCFPSDVERVLEDKCRLCHNDQLQFGAPMSLATYADSQLPAPQTPGQQVWEEIGVRIHSTQNPMPPTGLPALSSGELAILDLWVAANAPPCTQ